MSASPAYSISLEARGLEPRMMRRPGGTAEESVVIKSKILLMFNHVYKMAVHWYRTNLHYEGITVYESTTLGMNYSC